MNKEQRSLIDHEFSQIKSLYFNAAYLGPSPARCRAGVEETLGKELNPSFVTYESWFYRPEKSRELYAKLLGTEANNIFHACSVSDINNLIAQSYPFENGDIITVINKDYPSNVLPFMLKSERSSNVSVEMLNLNEQIVPTPEWLEQNMSPKTKIFCSSWVTFDTGKKIDAISIGKYLKSKGIFFVLDVTQAFGGLSIPKELLEVVDAISCASYKWLLGPYGHAFGYISAEAQKILQHPNANWVTSANSTNVYDLLTYTTKTIPGARRFDRGQTANLLTISSLEKSLELLDELGLENIEKYNQELTKYFCSKFNNPNYEIITPQDMRGNIICLKIKSKDENLNIKKQLESKNIDVSVREGSIRISFHLYNTTTQIDQILAILNK